MEREKLPQVLLASTLINLFFINFTEAVQPTAAIKHFVLVHGACHGAWSWYKIVALMRSSGHNVTALDLAASGIDPKQVDDVPLIADYFRPLMDFMAALPPRERVVLVGHSYGGLAISKAMERFPEKIAVAVFVSAVMPGPAFNVSFINQEAPKLERSLLDSTYIYGDGPQNPPTAFLTGPLYLATYMYGLCPIEDLALATTLLRPLRVYSTEDAANEVLLTSRNFGSVNRVFIVTDNDEQSKDMQLWMVENNPPNEFEIIVGSDHMVMMSKPRELWLHLQRFADKYASTADCPQKIGNTN